MVETSPGLGDGRGVAEHADGALHLREVAAWNHGWWLVVDPDLEASWAPVHKLDVSLGLDGCDGGIYVFRDDITTVQETAGHVLAVAGVAFHHLLVGLEAGVSDLGNSQLLVVGLHGRDDRGIGGEREMDSGVGHQVGLELRQVNVEGAVEAERRSNGGHNLAYQTIQVGVRGSLDVEVASADVVDGFVVDHEGAVGVLQSVVGGQD